MPRISFGTGITPHPSAIDSILGRLLREAVFVSGGEDAAEMTLATGTVQVTGRGLLFDPENGSLVDGVLDGLVATLQPGNTVTMARLGLDLAGLRAAAEAEAATPGSSALEDLLYPLDWVFLGNSAGEYVLGDDTNADGNPVSLSGDNLVRLRFGTDLFFAGDGADTLFGGQGIDALYGEAGDDLLDGGRGRDGLYGGEGNDVLRGRGQGDLLSGGEGDDLLRGGRDNDEMFGDAGADTLAGGSGDDCLHGGAGADVFVFGPANGTDNVFDAVPGEDVIRFEGLTDQTLTAIEFVNGASVWVEVTYGGGKIFLLGLRQVDVNDGLFEFV